MLSAGLSHASTASAPASQVGAAPDTQAIVQRVDEHYNHLTSLRARFTERYQGLGMDRTESGTLTLRKPGQMRWDYDAPAGKVFLVRGKTALSYTPGDPQAEQFSSKTMDDLRSPLRLLLGHTRLSHELDQLSVAPDRDGYLIIGIPHGAADRVRSLSLRVDHAGTIRSLRFVEADGAATSFEFTAIAENLPVPPSTFEFQPPPGVTVVEATAPI